MRRRRRCLRHVTAQSVCNWGDGIHQPMGQPLFRQGQCRSFRFNGFTIDLIIESPLSSPHSIISYALGIARINQNVLLPFFLLCLKECSSESIVFHCLHSKQWNLSTKTEHTWILYAKCHFLIQMAMKKLFVEAGMPARGYMHSSISIKVGFTEKWENRCLSHMFSWPWYFLQLC